MKTLAGMEGEKDDTNWGVEEESIAACGEEPTGGALSTGAELFGCRSEPHVVNLMAATI